MKRAPDSLPSPWLGAECASERKKTAPRTCAQNSNRIGDRQADADVMARAGRHARPAGCDARPKPPFARAGIRNRPLEDVYRASTTIDRCDKFDGNVTDPLAYDNLNQRATRRIPAAGSAPRATFRPTRRMDHEAGLGSRHPPRSTTSRGRARAVGLMIGLGLSTSSSPTRFHAARLDWRRSRLRRRCPRAVRRRRREAIPAVGFIDVRRRSSPAVAAATIPRRSVPALSVTRCDAAAAGASSAPASSSKQGQ